LGGATCSCAKALFGRYLQRVDGAVLAEADPPSTTQTPVLDADTGLPLADVAAVYDGSGHGCAVLGTAKEVRCWRMLAGGNSAGELGNGTADDNGPLFRATPVLTAASQRLGNVVSISPSSWYWGTATCAVTGDGKIYCWGNLVYLSNGGTALISAYAVPITTDGVTPFTGALQVTQDGYGYACALRQGASAKEVWCWGNNSGYVLGTGDNAMRYYPTKIAGVADPKTLSSFGYYGTTCALDGSNVRCWGANVNGEVGNGTTATPILSPTIVTLMGGTTALTNVVEIVGGLGINNSGDYTCALSSNNTVQCWGYGFQSYPTTYGVPNVVALGGIDGGLVRVLTSDGVYHLGTATRAPNCGLLQ
jgi:alpha-tubulin suppressor-like RCC1 family protein